MEAASTAKVTKKEAQQGAAFAQPCNPQTASRLIQLPPELRLKIMRMLHKNTGPLDSMVALPASTYHFSKRDYGDADRSVVELSTQMLACCQVLQREASPILYEENTLGIEYSRSRSPYCRHFHVLDVLGRLATRPEELPTGSEVDHLESLIDAWTSSRASWPELYRLRKFYQAVKNIRKIQLTVEYKDSTDMFMACKFFKALLLDKDVVFIPKDKSNGSGPSELDCIKSSRMLRCRSITFASSLNLSWLVDGITGVQPFQDLFPTWIKLRRVIIDLPEVNGVHFFAVKHREGDTIIDDLRNAVMHADVTRAEQHITVLTDQLATWNVTAFEHEVAKARQQYEGRIARLREARTGITERVEEARIKPPFRQ